jgi:hypothetical protein
MMTVCHALGDFELLRDYLQRVVCGFEQRRAAKTPAPSENGVALSGKELAYLTQRLDQFETTWRAAP